LSKMSSFIFAFLKKIPGGKCQEEFRHFIKQKCNTNFTADRRQDLAGRVTAVSPAGMI